LRKITIDGGFAEEGIEPGHATAEQMHIAERILNWLTMRLGQLLFAHWFDNRTCGSNIDY